jgi:hypothetical protein
LGEGGGEVEFRLQYKSVWKVFDQLAVIKVKKITLILLWSLEVNK